MLLIYTHGCTHTIICQDWLINTSDLFKEFFLTTQLVNIVYPVAHCHSVTQSPPPTQASIEVPVHPSSLEVYLINGKKVTVTVDTSDRRDQVLEVSKAAVSRGPVIVV